ncbi:phosphoribosylglycinamide formyltransferase [Lacihabitans sp. CCS-44]|uniref:phosphoribosylglycinamide formyltransferase n=1 Tax=Lacihabitans sp. CCS-44 TaxID=2487331 RepID=UPI0020CE06B9|nr:phosphoribosylglycinamide formyltransferase [Lacihabitans sp. CCS-44]MCP9756898.1 phosphoribosylglycinamide formyltransferase [Lacihabitans sp. CCS-44]
MIKIAIFASGSGSNAERIVEFFSSNEEIEVTLVLTNNPAAGVIERAQRLNIPTLIFNKTLFSKTDKIVEILQSQQIDWVILAGFLWLVPNNLTRAFENRMINIHPALLPKYGGKGMWGHYVHEAVVANQEKESGITIHYVNEKYDEGKVIFQAKCEVTSGDSPEDVAKKIHELEYQYFPEIIYQEILSAKNSIVE